MRPTTPELLSGIARALESQVLPKLEDKWAASTVRSAIQLLDHLERRVELEPGLLAIEHDELDALFAQIIGTLREANWAGLPALLEFGAAGPATVSQDLAGLAARDEARLAILETLVARRVEIARATGSDELHKGIIAYLLRRIGREKPMILPVLLGPPF